MKHGCKSHLSTDFVSKKVPENPVESDTTETPYLILLDEVEATFPDKGAAAIQDIFLLVLVKTRCEALALTKVMQKESRLKREYSRSICELVLSSFSAIGFSCKVEENFLF